MKKTKIICSVLILVLGFLIFTGYNSIDTKAEDYTITVKLHCGEGAFGSGVTVDGDGNSTVENITQMTYSIDKFPKPSRSGYEFCGWSIKEDAEYGVEYLIPEGTYIGSVACGKSYIDLYPIWRDKNNEDAIVYDGSGFAGGSGTEDDPYLISTKEELLYFSFYERAMVNYEWNYQKNEFFKLTQDIELNDEDTMADIINNNGTYTDTVPIMWVPVNFMGVFDGDNHVIKGLYCYSYDNYVGMFRSLQDYSQYGCKVQIKNLEISECYICGKNGYVGGILGRGVIPSSTTSKRDYLISGCLITGNSYIIGKSYVGGIIGEQWKDTLVDNCSCLNVTIEGSNAGGIAGSGYNISNCICEKIIVRGTSDAGGIAGYCYVSGDIDLIECSCIDGDIQGKTAGGIVGRGGSSGSLATITKCSCKNTNIQGKTAGGIAGDVQFLIQNCVCQGNSSISAICNSKNSGDSYAGGIAGKVYATTISGCTIETGVTIESKVTSDGYGYAYAGGVSGFSDTISDCAIGTGITIKATNDRRENAYAGGIAGRTISSISGCTSGAEMTIEASGSSDSYCGGIVGYMSGTISECTSGTGMTIKVMGSSESCCGGIAGYTHGTISNCTSETGINVEANSEKGTVYTGGIAGYTDGATNECTSKVESVTATGKTGYCGGIAGSATTISDCVCETGIVIESNSENSNAYAGGIAGSATTINECTSVTGMIIGASSENGYAYAGGIAGSATTISGCVCETGIVIESNSETSNAYAGGIAGYTDGATNSSKSITDCICKENVTIISKTENESCASYAGGIVGQGTALIDSCINYSDISQDSDVSGGIVAFYETSYGYSGVCKISNCTNYGEINAKKTAGGIGGSISGCYEISNCENNGNVSATMKIGGIAGKISGTSTCNAIVSDCINNGNVEQEFSDDIIDYGDYYNGGIVGLYDCAYIVNCINNGNVIQTIISNAAFFGIGGIAGKLYDSGSKYEVINCTNNGKVIAVENGKYVGGVVGEGKVSGCINTGEVSESGSYYGSVAGLLDSTQYGYNYYLGDNLVAASGKYNGSPADVNDNKNSAVRGYRITFDDGITGTFKVLGTVSCKTKVPNSSGSYVTGNVSIDVYHPAAGKAGESIKLTLSGSDYGYKLVTDVKGGKLIQEEDGTYTLIMPAGDVIIKGKAEGEKKTSVISVEGAYEEQCNLGDGIVSDLSMDVQYGDKFKLDVTVNDYEDDQVSTNQTITFESNNESVIKTDSEGNCEVVAAEDGTNPAYTVITINIAENDEYEASTKYLRIYPSKRKVNATVKAKDRAYLKDNLNVELESGSVENAVAGDDVVVDLTDAIGVMDTASVGVGKSVSVSGVKLSGADADKYELIEQPGEVTVSITLCTHDGYWGEWTVINEATTTAKGVDIRICDNCGKIEARIVDEIRSDDPPADDPPIDNPPIDNPPIDNPPVDNPPIDNPPVDNPPVDNPPIDNPPTDNPPTDVENPDSQVNMYRLYNPNSGEHFYTASAGEKDFLVSVGWNYEGIGWTAPAISNTPVYRLYNPNAGEHHYTMSTGERDFLISVGWNDEGIGWYSDDAQGVPIYRQYNPNAVTGSHNYTTSKAENDWLISIGWNAEGIGWYGIK